MCAISATFLTAVSGAKPCLKMASSQIDEEETKSTNNLNESQSCVYTWLNDVVQLPEYFQLFIDEGYDFMDSIMDMNEDDLRDIGIVKKGHRKRILKCLQKRNMETNENDDACPSDQTYSDTYQMKCDVCNEQYPLEKLCKSKECVSNHKVHCQNCVDHHDQNMDDLEEEKKEQYKEVQHYPEYS